MRVVINACFGGFSLSARAVKRMAELNGRECYFFRNSYEHLGDKTPHGHLIPISAEEADEDIFFRAFDIPNPNEICVFSQDWHSLPLEVRQAENERYSKHSLPDGSEIDRTDPKLIQVIEELGSGHRTGASGRCAELRIVEIPDGTDYEISEYDGNEHIAEKHQTWS